MKEQLKEILEQMIASTEATIEDLEISLDEFKKLLEDIKNKRKELEQSDTPRQPRS